MERIPAPGDDLNIEDIDMIFEAVRDRQDNFPNEPATVAFGLVLLNIGDRFTSVKCINGEWEGLKMEIPKRDGIPLCPNGHVMVESNSRLRLGWING